MTEVYGHFDRIKRPANTDDLFLTWDVPYVPGKLEVVGYHEGKERCRYTVETTGAPAQIAITPDISELKADGRSVAQLEIRILDSQGRLVPTANCGLSVSLEGDGRILGIDNGRLDSHECWKDTDRAAFHGMMFVVVQAGENEGKLKLTVTGEGLQPAETELAMVR